MTVDEAKDRLRCALGEPSPEGGQLVWRCALDGRPVLVRLVGGEHAAVFVEPEQGAVRTLPACPLRFARLDSGAWLEFALRMLHRTEVPGRCAGEGRT